MAVGEGHLFVEYPEPSSGTHEYEVILAFACALQHILVHCLKIIFPTDHRVNALHLDAKRFPDEKRTDREIAKRIASFTQLWRSPTCIWLNMDSAKR